MTEEQPRTLSQFLVDIFRDHPEPQISFGDLIKAFNERGFGILLIIFASPTALPFPMPPGVTAVLAIPLLFLSVQLLMGRHSPWFPEKIANKTLNRDLMQKVVGKLAHYMAYIDRFIHPRMAWLSSHRAERFIGAWCLLFSISVAMPFPLSNTMPSIGIVLLSLGLLERDGYLIIGGIIIGIFGMCASALLAIFGFHAINWVIDWFNAM